ncbi:MAG: sigma 54-interacting transcriptional regulator [Bacteroidia bacterium]|nr:sigma 54-interacting transcriptional regulator [Bacteroidia bacterium]
MNSQHHLLKIKTLGGLKAAGYTPLPVKEELRKNLMIKLRNKEKVFESIHAFNDTVIPDIERALLSRHNILLLGLRGQAKTKLARLMTNLLDEYIPGIAGSEIHDDPFSPVSRYGADQIASYGDDTEIEWIHRENRYTEKLATPDVSVADLIGDVDPIKAANLKIPYSDERAIHFGLIPRAHRGIFVINELPDLQARIQVSLFNILQEGDIQIRGFNIRLPLDIQFVFTANPEDYTNRGSIVTPLKDRIESQILTHYPKDIMTSRQITLQEASLSKEQKERISASEPVLHLLEQIAFEARDNEFIDPRSGVSARLTISGYENLFSAAERRMLLNGENTSFVRITDFWGVIPSITGKIELVYEGEQEGAFIVAQNLIGKATRTIFPAYFPAPDRIKKSKEPDPYREIHEWFNAGNEIDLLHNLTNKEYANVLGLVPGLEEAVRKYHPKARGQEKLLLMEFLIHGLAEYSILSKNQLSTGLRFKDLFTSVFNQEKEE